MLRSLELSHEIGAAEEELSDLRSRVDEDSSTFAALEQQIAELRENLARTRASVDEREQLLAEKRAELEEAKRLEVLADYDTDLRSHRKAGADVVQMATDLIKLIDAYDDKTVRLRQRLDDMRDAFGRDERVEEVEAALEQEPDELKETWAAVVGVVGWRVSDGRNGDPIDCEAVVVFDEPQHRFPERRRALIKEYFGKR